MPKKIRRKTPRVAILLESSHEVSRGMIRGILKYVRLYGKWDVHIVSGGAQDQQLPDRRYWKGDGIIGRIPNRRVARDIVEAGLATIVIDPIDEFLCVSHPLSNYPSVRCDSRAVGRMAADYLLQRRFENFAFFGEPSGINWSRIRHAAFENRLIEAGFSCLAYPLPASPSPDWIIERKHVGRWLRSLSKPVAILAANDHRARRLLDSCRENNLSVPYQVAVLGVNNDELICETTSPPLSSISLECVGAGFTAAQMLDKMMKGEHAIKSPIFFSAVNVIERESAENKPLFHKAVVEALEFVRINTGMQIRVGDVANHMGVTRQWAEKLFKKEVGHSIMDEIKRVRMQTVRLLVEQTDIPFREIATQCGFECANHLGIIFKKETGMTMGRYRAKSPRGGRKEDRV